MKLKDGASLKDVSWRMFAAAIVCEAIYWRWGDGADLVITAGTDGKHMDGSLHYKGMALDLRTRDVPPALLPELLHQLKVALGQDYDVVLEGDHIHVEYDPKG